MKITKKFIEFLKYCFSVGLIEVLIWFILKPQLRNMAISIEITSLIIDTVNFNIGFIIKKFIVFMGDQKIKSWEQYILSLGTSILNSSISMAIIYMLDNWTDIRDENILKGLTSLILLSIIYPVNRLIFGRRK